MSLIYLDFILQLSGGLFCFKQIFLLLWKLHRLQMWSDSLKFKDYSEKKQMRPLNLIMHF